MGLKMFYTIVMFVFVTSSQRAFVYGRLEAEGSRGYCAENDSYAKRDQNFARRIHQVFGNNVHKINMECGGHTSIGPGIIIKELNSTWSYDSETEHCTFKIQAPEDYRVYVYAYSYSWVSVDSDSCVSNSAIAAAVTSFLDGTNDKKSLLYNSEYEGALDITKAISTGRELLIDSILSAKRARSFKSQRLVIRYAFIKKDNGKVIVYGE